MLENERDFCDGELEDLSKLPRLYFGDLVDTPDGIGRLCELDPESELRYGVALKSGLSWYSRNDLTIVKE